MNPATEPRPPRLALIAAVTRRGGIGLGNALVWREPADLKHFKALTLGHPVIMGRRTWDSIGRPLPGRRNLVLTRDAGWQADGAERVGSLAEALARAADVPLAFVIGGAQVYAQALPFADTLHLTEVDIDRPADAFFPAWPRDLFIETTHETGMAADGIGYRFVTYQRRA